MRWFRQRLRLTQRDFANLFGISVATLRHWERGNRKPTKSALVLLYVIKENPRVVRQAVQKIRLRNPGLLTPVEWPLTYRMPPGFGERGPPLKPRGPRRRS
jgi:transcriptional regulator with XRE-family HTH domain